MSSYCSPEFSTRKIIYEFQQVFSFLQMHSNFSTRLKLFNRLLIFGRALSEFTLDNYTILPPRAEFKQKCKGWGIGGVLTVPSKLRMIYEPYKGIYKGM